MPKIAYEERKFRDKSLKMIEQVNEIITSYRYQGYDLTLRQLYYQLVSRDVIPNKQREYSNLGSLVSNARRAGLIDWDAIVDRTRYLRGLQTFDDPSEPIQNVARSFRYDFWEKQPVYVEVWFEKDALMGVFERAANARRVNYFSCRGYASDSEIWGAARRLRAWGTYNKETRGKLRQLARDIVILHFGDHDPSGIDMTRDIEERLRLFGAPRQLDVRRLALNMDQIELYSPPPNPAKEVDPRFEGYKAEYGNESWELDALEPRVLAELVRSAVDDLIDPKLWEKEAERERLARAQLTAIADNYDSVVADLNVELPEDDDIDEDDSDEDETEIDE